MIPSRACAMLRSVASWRKRRATGMVGKSPVGLGGEPAVVSAVASAAVCVHVCVGRDVVA